MADHAVVDHVAIDWGSTSFRAYRFDHHGELQETLPLPSGIKSAQAMERTAQLEWFEQTLFDAVGHWLQPQQPILLSGMITSRNGWFESPYLQCPVALSDILPQAVITECRGHPLKFLPGVALGGTAADVMRGEELQLIGLTEESPAIYVMPGTHSKWVLADRESLHSFRTLPTGEIFDVLINHTLMGGLATAAEESGQGAAHSDVFTDAVAKGFRSDEFIASLFFARAGVLLEKLGADDVRPYLSGLLIGREIKEAMGILESADESTGTSTGLTLIGDSKLCSLYQQAFDVLDISASYQQRDTTEMSYRTLLFGHS